jgi:hypothetical protein
MSSEAQQAWFAAKGSPARNPFVAGYNTGSVAERGKIAGRLRDHADVIEGFAVAGQAVNLVAFLITLPTIAEEAKP